MFQTIVLGFILLTTLYILKHLRDPKLNMPPLVRYKIPIIGHTFRYTFNCENSLVNAEKSMVKCLVYIYGVEQLRLLEKNIRMKYSQEVTCLILGSYGKMIRGSSISNKLNLYTERIQKSLYLATQKHIGDCNDQKVIYNIYSAITKIISASIANVFIGEEESEYDDVISTFAEFTKDIAVFFLIPPIFDLIFPGLQDFVKRIPIRLGLYNPVTRHVNTLIKHVKHQVDKRLREKQKYGDSWKRPTDLLQDFMEQKSFDPNNINYTALASNLSIFIFASIHSTSRACANVVVDLASRPEYMQELYEEQLEIHKKTDENGILPFESLKEMKNLDSFIRESLRFTGDVAALPHWVLKDHTFSNGLQVPKGHVVDIYSYDTYHDESLQGPNPTSFEPHRHNVPASKVGRNFLTFGGGKHMCPGRFLAINEIKFFMHNAILNYNIRTESGKIEDKFRLGPVALPSNNGIIFEKRAK
ncbi:unnamed protein product [Rhizophagus irregularis]|nr:unnamed protein product [Rhizophagus irregularis]